MDINDPRLADDIQAFVQSEIKKFNRDNKSVPKLAVVQNVGTAYVTVYYPDEETNTFDVYNFNEVPCEIGDQIYISDVSGGKKVDFRKTIQFDNIYVDYVNGVDAYADSDGNSYGTKERPFSTLQYAINRLPKNLNRRVITIECISLDTSELITINGITSGYITIKRYNPETIISLSGFIITNCSGIYLDINYLEFTRDDYWAIQIFNSSIINFNYCKLNTSANTGGFFISTGSKVIIQDSIIANRTIGIRVELLSELYSMYNTGANSVFGLVADACSTIGKNGSQPTGSIANESVSSGSVIR